MDKRIKAALDKLVGQTITFAAVDTDGTLELVLGDGSIARVMCDPEGNGPGSLHYYDADFRTSDDYGTPIGGR